MMLTERESEIDYDLAVLATPVYMLATPVNRHSYDAHRERE